MVWACASEDPAMSAAPRAVKRMQFHRETHVFALRRMSLNPTPSSNGRSGICAGELFSKRICAAKLAKSHRGRATLHTVPSAGFPELPMPDSDRLAMAGCSLLELLKQQSFGCSGAVLRRRKMHVRHQRFVPMGKICNADFY